MQAWATSFLLSSCIWMDITFGHWVNGGNSLNLKMHTQGIDKPPPLPDNCSTIWCSPPSMNFIPNKRAEQMLKFKGLRSKNQKMASFSSAGENFLIETFVENFDDVPANNLTTIPPDSPFFNFSAGAFAASPSIPPPSPPNALGRVGGNKLIVSVKNDVCCKTLSLNFFSGPGLSTLIAREKNGNVAGQLIPPPEIDGIFNDIFQFQGECIQTLEIKDSIIVPVSLWALDDLTCKFESPQCSIGEDPHVTTFGNMKYKYAGVGEHLLTKWNEGSHENKITACFSKSERNENASWMQSVSFTCNQTLLIVQRGTTSLHKVRSYFSRLSDGSALDEGKFGDFQKCEITQNRLSCKCSDEYHGEITITGKKARYGEYYLNTKIKTGISLFQTYDETQMGGFCQHVSNSIFEPHIMDLKNHESANQNPLFVSAISNQSDKSNKSCSRDVKFPKLQNKGHEGNFFDGTVFPLVFIHNMIVVHLSYSHNNQWCVY